MLRTICLILVHIFNLFLQCPPPINKMVANILTVGSGGPASYCETPDTAQPYIHKALT
jgi:hypothetical protein